MDRQSRSLLVDAALVFLFCVSACAGWRLQTSDPAHAETTAGRNGVSNANGDRISELETWAASSEIRIASVESRITLLENDVKVIDERYNREVAKVMDSVLYLQPDLEPNWAYRVSAIIFHHSTLHSIDPILIVSIIHVESRFNPGARGKAGEVGLMQVMKFWCKHFKTTPRKLAAPAENIRVGTGILALALDECAENTHCALRHYNGSKAYADKVSAVYLRMVNHARGRDE